MTILNGEFPDVPYSRNSTGRYPGWSLKPPELWRRSLKKPTHPNAPMTIREREAWRDAVKMLLRREHNRGYPIKDPLLRKWAGIQ